MTNQLHSATFIRLIRPSRPGRRTLCAGRTRTAGPSPPFAREHQVNRGAIRTAITSLAPEHTAARQDPPGPDTARHRHARDPRRPTRSPPRPGRPAPSAITPTQPPLDRLHHVAGHDRRFISRVCASWLAGPMRAAATAPPRRRTGTPRRGRVETPSPPPADHTPPPGQPSPLPGPDRARPREPRP